MDSAEESFCRRLCQKFFESDAIHKKRHTDNNPCQIGAEQRSAQTDICIMNLSFSTRGQEQTQ